jgi:hypothetical protein
MEAFVVTVIMQDLDSVLCSVLLKSKLSSKCFVRLVVELDVDKSEAAEVDDKDGGALILFLGKFAFQLCIVIRSTKMHSLGLVTTKTLWLALVSSPCQGILVIAPNRQPATWEAAPRRVSLESCH